MDEPDERTALLSCSAPAIRLSSSTSGGNENKRGFLSLEPNNIAWVMIDLSRVPRPVL